MIHGWMVEVEKEEGIILFAVRVCDPNDAEDIVRSLRNYSDDVDIFATTPIDIETLDGLKIGQGEIRGPM